MTPAAAKAFSNAYDRAAARRDEARISAGIFLELAEETTSDFMEDASIRLARRSAVLSRRYCLEANAYSRAMIR